MTTAIRELSSLEEWKSEWDILSGEIKSFKQTKLAEYNDIMAQWQNAQANCSKVITLQKKKVEAFKDSLKRVSKFCNEDETIQGLYKNIEENEKQIQEMSKNLPVNIGLFLRCCLGDIDLSLYKRKLQYKNKYEKFKMIMTLISFFFSILNLLVFNHRFTDALFHAVLLWYYSSLTLQEHILLVNGSRIKNWWILHHYLSILLSGFLLIWPDGLIYEMYRNQFIYFSIYLSFVQFLQYNYQKRVLYRLRALGASRTMDVTVEGVDTKRSTGLGFIVPFLCVGYFLQFYNAFILYRLSRHPKCDLWQVPCCAVLFLVLGAGNLITLIYVIKQKAKVHLKST
ncbi:transmembrane protein 120A-like isoform X1 [Dendronephthya gigantea]|uniref:transmembrane protein 120A-like isoform X1 n=1 Tax=Dendronephthya gigantea TaxID=151771 RepID=UPI00106C3A6D|nr:transmembrane protein 120A-like isoform X1 [Dendronephthya gigantea]